MFPLLGILGLLAVAGSATADVHLTDPDTGVAERDLGWSLATIPDLDGDGRDELLVGLPGHLPAGGNGAVALWYGGRELTEAPDRFWTGAENDRLGWAVAHAGDLDGDGRADLALGAPWHLGSRGRVLIIHGAADLPASGPVGTAADRVLLGENGGDQFGFAVEAAGDFDGDGRDDLIVGAPYSFGARGSAYVVYGASGGVSNDLADATTLAGQFGGNRFGWSVSGAGAFLGGNEECVAVGAPYYTLYGLDAGGVFVYEGSLGGAAPDTTIERILRPDIANRAGALYGFVVRGGRWNTDGYGDVAVGGPGANDGSGIRGRVEIHFGGTSVDGLGDRWLEGVAANDSLGYALDWVYEPGSDSPDLLVGAPYANLPDDQGNGTSDGGRAYRWAFGAASGGAGTAAEQLPVTPLVPVTAGGDHYGGGVSSAGDFDGDGQADLAIGAPTGNIGNNAEAGYVHLRTAQDLVVPNLLTSWRAAWSPGGGAELSFVLSRPRHEIARLDLVRRAAGAARTLWSGPALADAAGPGGGLWVDRDGYHLHDPAAAPGSRYDLAVVGSDGERAVLTALAGPAGPAPGAPALVLDEVRPNPANPMARIRFRAATGTRVTVAVHDLRGRLVRRLDAGPASGTWQEVVWDGRTGGGADAASGVYLVRVAGGDDVRTARLTLAR